MTHRLRLTHAPVLAFVLSLAIAGCDEGKNNDAADQADSGPEEAVAIAVDCSFVFGDDAQIDVTYETSGMAIDTAVGGKLIASGVLWDDEFEGRSFSLTIFAEDSSVSTSSLYQMDRTRLPANEFYGNHGFTGLRSVRDPDAQGTLQFACFARDPGDSPKFWQN